jgi:hypothetical protein
MDLSLSSIVWLVIAVTQKRQVGLSPALGLKTSAEQTGDKRPSQETRRQ